MCLSQDDFSAWRCSDLSSLSFREWNTSSSHPGRLSLHRSWRLFWRAFRARLGAFPVPVVAFALYYWTYRLFAFRVSIGFSLVLFISSWLAWTHGISFSVSSSSLGFLQKRAASSSLLKSPVSLGESSGRRSMDEVSKKTDCSEIGFCHIAEGFLRQDCSFDSIWISSVATESSVSSLYKKSCFEFIYPLWPLSRAKSCIQDFGTLKSWTQDFGKPKSWSQPKSWIQDCGKPNSWSQPKSSIQGFLKPKS